MKTNRLIVLVTSLCLSASVLLANPGKDKDEPRRGDFLVHNVYDLNLSDKEKEDIKKIIDEKMAMKKDELTSLFSEKGFDKKAFIEMENNKRENMLKSRADMIEKVYAVLTVEQKKQFIENLKKEPKEPREPRDFKGKKGDKDCHDRG